MAQQSKATTWQKLEKWITGNSEYAKYNIDQNFAKNIDPADYEAEKLEKQQTAYLQSQWRSIDSELYQKAVFYEPTRIASYYDYESMEYSVAGDSGVPTPDGIIKIEDLAAKGRDHEFITYAYDFNREKLVPAKAYNAHKSKDEFTYKITFDDDSHIIATPEHRFLKRNGQFEMTKNLQPGDSMMPFYRKNGYVYSCNDDIGWEEESKIGLDKMLNLSPHPIVREQLTKLKLNIAWDNFLNTVFYLKNIRNTANYYNVEQDRIVNFIKNHGFSNWETFCKAYGIQSHNKEGRGALNHTIKSIEPYGVIPVYDLTVPGHKNFATDTIISHNTPEISAALDIYSEEATTPDEFGRMLQIYSESEQIKNELEDLFYNKLDINANLPPWIRNTPIRKDSIIPLLNGTEDEIQNISKRVNEGEEVWTYSVQDNTKQIKPGKIVWCGLTRENSSMVRVTLDDNTCIDSTPDHEFMLRNGSYKRADKLQENDSLMPFYTYKSDGQFYGYEKVYNPKNRHYKYSHRMVAHECIRDKNYEDKVDNDFLTHHIDFNKLNNHPNNLQRMTFSEHGKLHETLSKIGSEILQRPDVKQKRYEALQKFLRSDYRRRQQSQKYEGHYPEDFKKYNNSNEHRKHNHIRKETTQSIWDDPTRREQRKESMRVKFDDYVWNEIENAIERGDIKFRKDVVPYINKNLFNHILSINKNRRLHNKGKISERIFLERIKDYGYNTPKEYLDSKTECILNHKVKSVEFLSETDDVYCMEIHGPNGERDRHNFPVCGKDLNGNYDRNNGAFISNCKYGDNFVYLKMFPKKGIVDVSQLPNMEITRVEPDFQKITKLNSFEQEQNIQFQWRNKDLHFNSFEIAHFRLLGDDRRLPYGTSVLEKARRIWKQLMLAEDAMMVYRTSRAPERRIYKIYVGNMDDNDVNQYVDKIANEFKRSKVTDASTGNMDTRYNQLAVDQDYFIPVRDPNQASPIETLAGADNLSEIADIQYVQRKLFTALRVPKTFLGFDEDVGEGKNLALMDIRFSRAIHRVQKSIVQELNKIALIHLYLKGYKDDLENFELGLTSPSTQADLLQLEGWQQKMDIYKASVEKVNNGMSAMSATKAKKEILGMSDEEIRLDLQRQAVEEAANQEMDAISEAVVETGVFNTLYDIYNIRPEEDTTEEDEGGDDDDEGGSIGGSAGGSLDGKDLGGEDEGEEDQSGEEAEEPEGEELSEQRRKIDLREVKQQNTERINLQESKSKNQHRIKNMMEEIDNLFEKGNDTRDVLNENENKNYDENDNE
jgi:hypothetical protein